MMAKSPLTGEELQDQPQLSPDRLYLNFSDQVFGNYAVWDGLISLGFCYGEQLQCHGYNPPMEGDLFLNGKQTKKMMALARSKVYEAKIMHTKPPLFLLRRYLAEAEAIRMPRPDRSHTADKFQLIYADELYRQAEALTWKEREARTLSNFVEAEGAVGSGIKLPLLNVKGQGVTLSQDSQLGKVRALTHSCTDEQAIVVLNLLLEHKYLSAPETQSVIGETPFCVTPAGYVENDSYWTGEIGPPMVFVICRFNETLDPVYDEICRKADGRNANEVIYYRVKDIEHVEQIDDKIIAEIKRATVVLVDLTENNFNVGFEAGFATALGKVVVWTHHGKVDISKLPFDIITRNILAYDQSDLEKFKHDLAGRMGAAVEMARKQIGVQAR